MKLTRRNLAALLTATAAAAQTAAQPPATTPPQPDDAAASRNALKTNLDTLSKAVIPMAVEPAFRFKA